jgi:hypothetical protein
MDQSSSNGRYLVEGLFRKHVEIWDAEHRNLLQTLPGKFPYAIAGSEDGRFLAIGDAEKIALWVFKQTIAAH